jgi:hypothetical protein
MKNHAAIVSALVSGKVKIYTDKVGSAYQNTLQKKMMLNLFLMKLRVVF